MAFLTISILVIGSIAPIISQAPSGFVLIKNPDSGLYVTNSDEFKVYVNSYKEGDDNQIWRLFPTIKGSYFILNKKDGGALEKSFNSSQIVAVPWHGCKDQQWIILPNDSIKNVENGLVFDIESNGGDGAKLIAYEANGRKNQFFEFEPV